MSQVTQGFSQLLYTYGPGAMLDLPDNAVVVAGLEDWSVAGGASRVIDEGRLTDLLTSQLGDDRLPSGMPPVLRTPPLHDDERRDDHAPGVEVRIFPECFVCDAAASDEGTSADAQAAGRETRRLLVRWPQITVMGEGRLRAQVDAKAVAVNPIRFVAACGKGHLEDIDWRAIVHRGGDQGCRRSMHWVERGVGADPSDVSVRCGCGAGVSLADLYKPGFLGRCRAFSPWLTPRWEAGEACDEELRLLPRSATNAYFPQTVTVISLPEAGDALARAVEEHWGVIASIRNVPGFVATLKALPMTSAAFAHIPDDEVLAAIERRGAAGSGSKDPRIEEFDRLSADTDVIGRDGADSRLFAQRLHVHRLAVPERVRGLVAGVVRVHRLREVACLYGFTRLEPAPTAMESELDEIRLAVTGAPLSRGATWLPATERFGEGVFLRLSSDAIAEWSARPEMRDHADRLKQGEALDARRRHRDAAEHLGVAYWAIHTLSHALMNELSLECGYPLSSLKERIYASKQGETPRHAILVYTATSGGQGTLGGLSAMADRVPQLLDRAIERAALCSNDPVCREHGPDDPHDDRHLHGAACHACLLVPETSCEARNGRLDRIMLLTGRSMSLLRPAAGG